MKLSYIELANFDKPRTLTPTNINDFTVISFIDSIKYVLMVICNLTTIKVHCILSLLITLLVLVLKVHARICNRTLFFIAL